MLTQEQQIIELIKKNKNILITFSKSWNGDAVASALSLFLFLKKLDKNVDVIAARSDQSQLYSFLPGYNEIKSNFDSLRKFIINLDLKNTKVSQVKYKIENNNLVFYITPQNGFFVNEDVSLNSSEFKYDLIIVIDTPDLESLGEIYDNETEFFYRTPVINIDHHANNESFGQINCVELTAVATSEILFSIFESFSRELIDEDIATCLLSGMISSTKSFKTPNITPQTLTVAAQLISLGARREEIINKFYRSRSLNMLKLWGRVLARLSGSLNNKIVWSMLNADDFAKTGSNELDLNEIIDEMIINIPQVKMILIFYEDTGGQPNTTNVLIYSVRNLDILSLFKDHSPVGTKNLARLTINKSLEMAKNEITPIAEEKIKKFAL